MALGFVNEDVLTCINEVYFLKGERATARGGQNRPQQKLMVKRGVRHEHSEGKRARQEASQLKRGVESMWKSWYRVKGEPGYSLDAACAEWGESDKVPCL